MGLPPRISRVTWCGPSLIVGSSDGEDSAAAAGVRAATLDAATAACLRKVRRPAESEGGEVMVQPRKNGQGNNSAFDIGNPWASLGESNGFWPSRSGQATPTSASSQIKVRSLAGS